MEPVLLAPLSEYLGKDPAALGPEFRFDGKEFQGSVGMYKFMAFAKRKLGRPVPVFPYGCSLAQAEALLNGSAGAADATAAMPEAPAGESSVAPFPGRAAFAASASDAASAPRFAESEATEPAAAPVSHAAPRPAPGAGIDIETVSAMPETHDYRSHAFYAETFTPAEIAYCILKPDPREAFCGLFCAKEALLKADPTSARGPLAAIEIGHQAEGRPYYKAGPSGVKPPYALSISHSGGMAVAVALPLSGTVTAALPPSAPGPRADELAAHLKRQIRLNRALLAGLALSFALIAGLAASFFRFLPR
jgi:phosphopantetheine--protein transferase-like protein